MASSHKEIDSAGDQIKKLQCPNTKGNAVKPVYCTSSQTWDLQGYL